VKTDLWRIVKRASNRKVVSEAFSDPRQVVLILLGAGINFSIGFGLFSSGIYALIVSQGGVLLTSGIPIQVSILTIVYFLVGAIYSTAASLALRPKRIINPIFVQLVTGSFVPVLVFYLVILAVPLISIGLAVFVAFITFLLALAMFMSAGLGQFLLVKYLVGLNGTKNDTRSSTLVLDSKLERVLEVLDTGPVHTAFGTELQMRKDNFKIFRTNPKASEQFYLLVMGDSQNGEKTQLATVAYRLGLFGITVGEGKVLDEMRSNALRQVLSDKGIVVSDGDATDALTRAYDYALEPTRTKFFGLRSESPHLGFVLVGIVLMFSLTTVLWKLGILPLDLYETFLILSGLALLFDFLPLIGRRGEKRVD